MAFGKKNEVKIDPFNYNIGLLGESGVGKTTIIHEMCKSHLPDGGYLFVECGKEDGADAIEGIPFVNCPEWSMDYDEDTNSVGFEDLIQDILDNKATEYPNLRVLVVDTYDQYRDIASTEVIRIHNKDNPDKRVKSLKAAMGGYMAGEDFCDDMMLEKLWSLKSVGVHFIVIGHLKQREITDAVTGETYMQVTTDMPIRSFNKLKNKLHFLGVATIDREIVKERKNAKTKDTKGIVTGETRRITFRDDNYSIDSKSRFANIANQIEFSPEVLYQTLCDAIKAEQSKSNKTYEETKAEQDELAKVKEKRIAEAEKAARVEKELEEIKMEIVEFFNSNKTNLDVIKPVLKVCKESGFNNPTEIDDVEIAKKVLAATK